MLDLNLVFVGRKFYMTVHYIGIDVLVIFSNDLINQESQSPFVKPTKIT